MHGLQGRQKHRKKLLIIAVKVVIVVGIFYFGVAIGQGKISFGVSDLLSRSSQNKDLPSNLDYTSVNQVYNDLKANYDGKLSTGVLLDGLKQGLAQSTGDPYTEYFNAKDAKAFNEQLTGTFTGIGAELGKDGENNLIVVSPIAGFPADKAGLKAGDIITTINSISTSNMSIDSAVNRIRGPKNTSVTLKIIRSKSQTLNLTIIRDEINIPSVKSKIIGGQIGYMQISEFSQDTTGLAQTAANDFKKAGVKGVILDLRGDPGGYLAAAVDVSSLWLNNKTILTERHGGIIIQTYTSRGTPTLEGLPTAVLIDGGSASASEITAGALHDNKVATLVGAKSFGKGSVQEVKNLSGGAELKVTIARWYTPNGKNIDKQGIQPDKSVQLTADDAKNGRDPQLDAAINIINGKIAQ